MKLFKLKDSVMNGTVTMHSSEVFVYASSRDVLEKICQKFEEANRASHTYEIEEANVNAAAGSGLGPRIGFADDNGHIEWKKPFGSAEESFAALTDEQRLEIMREYCRYCGIPFKDCAGEVCHCENEE